MCFPVGPNLGLIETTLLGSVLVLIIRVSSTRSGEVSSEDSFFSSCWTEEVSVHSPRVCSF
ncbi:Uncharacterised protein [Chlamydia trachomatis]|nr:Uncharacterised protein [Chlamydia trachomatis]CRH48062.1 Uncharacterised protein [Chlamydia trachomatis]